MSCSQFHGCYKVKNHKKQDILKHFQNSSAGAEVSVFEQFKTKKLYYMTVDLICL